MTKFFNKLKKLYLSTIIPILEAKTFFRTIPVLSRTTSYVFLAPSQNLEKTNDLIPREHPDRHIDRRTDGQMDRRMDRWADGRTDSFLQDPSCYH